MNDLENPGSQRSNLDVKDAIDFLKQEILDQNPDALLAQAVGHIGTLHENARRNGGVTLVGTMHRLEHAHSVLNRLTDKYSLDTRLSEILKEEVILS